MHPKKRTAAPPQKQAAEYRRLWKIVDGAVADAFNKHPEYLSPAISKKVVRASVNKRVVGALLASLKGEEPDGDNAG
jgi:hypothetical protein